MSNQEVVELVTALRAEAKKNPVANDVFHMFAHRERARKDVTLTALAARMESEGFKHEPAEYAKVLKFLAEHRVGTLKKNGGGRIKALENVTMTLQSIGSSAIGSLGNVEAFRSRVRYSKLPEVTPAPAPFVERRVSPMTGSGAVAGVQLSVTYIINGKPITFNIPKEMNEQEIAALLAKFK